MSAFAAPFMGSLTKYADSNRENAQMEGWWAYRKRSSISGQPEPTYIDSMEKLKEFNRAEGLAAPGEVPTNSTVSADGRRIISDGMPGQWARGGGSGSLDALIPSRVWEMDKSLTSVHGKEPAPDTSGPPCTVQAVDAGMMEQFAVEMGS